MNVSIFIVSYVWLNFLHNSYCCRWMIDLYMWVLYEAVLLKILIRFNFLCCTSYAFWQMYNVMYPPFWYHIEYFYFLKISCSIPLYFFFSFPLMLLFLPFLFWGQKWPIFLNFWSQIFKIGQWCHKPRPTKLMSGMIFSFFHLVSSKKLKNIDMHK